MGTPWQVGARRYAPAGRAASNLLAWPANAE
jgi:hypothetical protein